MEGLNKRFMDDPEAFLRKTPIFETVQHQRNPPAQGVVAFDLAPFHQNSARINELASRGKTATSATHQIVAYWLPWQPSGTAQIQLGDNADFFFTSQLAGCQIRIVPGALSPGKINHPLVMHIAGNVTSPADKSGTVWRNRQAADAIRTAHPTLPGSIAAMGRSRALSSTGSGALGYDGECVNVVGYKKNSQWLFVGQQVDPDNLRVERSWRF